jgi:hypothetical protein
MGLSLTWRGIWVFTVVYMPDLHEADYKLGACKFDMESKPWRNDFHAEHRVMQVSIW